MKKNLFTTVIVTSDEAWGPVWHTQLHYAYELSNYFNVIYINPPFPGLYKNIKLGIKSRKLCRNLQVINYIKIVPAFFGKLAIWINDLLTSIRVLVALSDSVTRVIIWRIDHFRLHNLFFIKINYQIYHVIDHWVDFEEDKMLAKKSDLVVYTSPRFREHYGSIAKKSINIPQGVSDEEFLIDQNKVLSIEKEFKQFFFSCGTFSDAVSLEILERVADTYNDYNLVLAGPLLFYKKENIKKFQTIIDKENVFYLGIIPGKELKNYIAASIICLIHYPFELQSQFSVRSPLRVINYLAQGKPVVTSFSCEIDILTNQGIFYAANISEYLRIINNILNGLLLVNRKEIDNYLRTIRYDILIERIFNEISNENF